MFWKVEGRTGLYIFFKTVCDVYGLIPEDNYTIPAQAEGVEPPSEMKSSIPPLILKREPDEPGNYDTETTTTIGGLTDHSLSSATTKRHRHSPSIGATPVQTVVEEEEEPPETQEEPATQDLATTEEDQESESAITVVEKSEDDEDAVLNENVAPQEPSEVPETVDPPQTESASDEPSPEAAQGEEKVSIDIAAETVETTESATETVKTDSNEEDASPTEVDELESQPSTEEKPDEESSLANSADMAEGEEKS